MRYAYYDRLSARDRAIYRRSDAVTAVPLPSPERLRPAVDELQRALLTEERRAVQAAAGQLAGALVAQLSLPPVDLTVLAVRPASSWGELHGLYTREPGRVAAIQLWMRTVRHKRVVAFRTFLRTLLHEVGHHLDYELLRLPESFHTEGFFRRESNLFRQLVPEPAAAARLPPQGSPSPRPGRK